MFRNNNGIAERVDIKVGISDDDYQEVVEGLSMGDEIVIGPDKILRHLKDGEKINVKKNSGKSAKSPVNK